MKFTNRTWEIKELDKYSKTSRLIVIYGRRRVGKTTLLVHWLNSKKGLYSQAIQGSPVLQISQICQDLSHFLNSQIHPQNWIQFFELLEKSINEKVTICLDEFPYLVESDPTLPSAMQKWLDHNKNPKISFIISGSSQKMMHSIFLNQSSPLFGRAQRILKIEPMTYFDFCDACELVFNKIENFILYSMVGGLPKYWEALHYSKDPISLANTLYFDHGSLLENEPQRILQDEKVEGITPISILEAIGRGAHKPSEISSRVGAKQTSLSKVFLQLIDTSLIERQLPFGSPEKDAKKSLYKIKDPMLNFWYSVYSGARSQWQIKTKTEKMKLLHDFASQVFESEARNLLKGHRYWSDQLELDCITQTNKGLIDIFEIKFSKLSAKERSKIENNMSYKVQNLQPLSQWKINTMKSFDWNDYCSIIQY